ncbi:MAG: hypothetical protein MK101_00830 [Phycisphaerales bacterium]|nr:hypothetical protein [Phycisphaerales bacterium]
MIASPRRLLAGVGLTLMLSPALSAKDFEPAKVPSEMGRLVPDGAWAMIYTPSINHLIQEITPVARAIEPQAAQQLAMAPMMMSMIASEGGPEGGRPAKPASFHLDKPMGIAVGPTDPETGEPDLTIILSADNADKIRLSSAGMGGGPSKVVHLEGTDWVALTSTTFKPSANPNALCADLFEADISIALDQSTIVREYGPMIDATLSQMSNVPVPHNASPEMKEQMASLQKMQEMNAKQMKILLDAFRQWEIGVEFEGTKLDLLAQYKLSSDSAVKFIAGSSSDPRSPLHRLAGQVPDGMPIQFVLNKESVEAMMNFGMADDQAVYPKEVMDKIKAMMPTWETMVHAITDGVAGGMGFPASGFEIIQFSGIKGGAQDTDKILRDIDTAFTDLSDADLGIKAKPELDNAASSVTVDLTFDMDKMMKVFGMNFMDMPGVDPAAMNKHAENSIRAILGGDTLKMTYQAHGSQLGMVGGNSADLARTMQQKLAASTRGWSPSTLSKALGHSWADPTWAVTMDIRQVGGEMLEHVKTMVGPMRVMLPAAIPGGGAVELDMIGSSTDDASQIRVMTDIAQWINMMKDIQHAMEHHKTGHNPV